MPRKIDDVIVPEKKRTIRDIPIPERGKRAEKESEIFIHKKPSYEEHKMRKSSRRKTWTALSLAGVVIVFSALSFFNGATLAYVPKSTPVSFNGDVYTARKTGGSLSYSVVKLSKEKAKEVPASGTEPVTRKASGTIVVYNIGTQTQDLVETTRFEASEGKIYRIDKKITIPAKGSIEAIVYADQPGPDYNIGLSDFILPGLKGTSRFENVYARSKTPMSGGFVGNESVVKKEDKAVAEADLHTSLREELMSEAKAQVPEGFVMFPALTSVQFVSLPSAPGDKADSAKVSVRADFAGVMFKESELSKELSTSKITVGSGDSVDIVSLESLGITFAGDASPDLVSSDEINISVSGEGLVVWRTDEAALKADFANRHKRDTSSILTNYPTIVSATATVKPFWKSTFPSDSAKITVKKLLAK